VATATARGADREAGSLLSAVIAREIHETLARIFDIAKRKRIHELLGRHPAGQQRIAAAAGPDVNGGERKSCPHAPSLCPLLPPGAKVRSA
jgi:hypothetical protein